LLVGQLGGSGILQGLLRMDNIDQQIDLIAALNRLSPRQRKVILLWAAGYTQQEIATEYGVNQSTVSRWIAGCVHILGELFHYIYEDT